MLYTNAVIIVLHIIITYTVFIYAYSSEQLDFVLKYIGSKLILVDKHSKRKLSLVKEIILNKLPSNALSLL